MSMLKRPAARSVPARSQPADRPIRRKSAAEYSPCRHAPVLDLGQLAQGHVGQVGRLIMIKAFALGWCQMAA